MRVRLRSVKPASVLSSTAIAGVLIVAGSYLGFGVLRLDPLVEHRTVRMLVPNSGGVAVGSPVLLSGVRVGAVRAIDGVASGVQFTLNLEDRHLIPATSAVRIESLSALGEPYVEFDPPNQDGPYLRDGQLVDARSAPMPMSVPQVAVRAVQLLRQLDPNVLNSLVGTVDTAIRGTGGEMPRIERAGTLLAATILSRTDVLRRLLVDLQTIGADMGWAGPSLRSAGPEWVDFGTGLDTLITAAARVYEVGNSPADYNTGDGLVPFLRRLDEVLDKEGPRIGQLLPALRQFSQAQQAGQPIDISALISQALAMVGDDDAIHLQITVK